MVRQGKRIVCRLPESAALRRSLVIAVTEFQLTNRPCHALLPPERAHDRCRWRSDALGASHRKAADRPLAFTLLARLRADPATPPLRPPLSTRTQESSALSRAEYQRNKPTATAAVRWLARPKRLAAPPATVVRPMRAKTLRPPLLGRTGPPWTFWLEIENGFAQRAMAAGP